MVDNQRRAPAEPVEIEDIDPQADVRGRVVGSVIDLGEDSLTVDDGTGSVEVFADDGQLDDVEEQDTVRILGRVLPAPEGFELQAEALHVLSVGRETYDSVKKIVNTTS
jgi:OB-fold nucleic acid binding domain.